MSLGGEPCTTRPPLSQLSEAAGRSGLQLRQGVPVGRVVGEPEGCLEFKPDADDAGVSGHPVPADARSLAVLDSVAERRLELPRQEVQLGSRVGEGANAMILKATFRRRPCVAKMLKRGVTTNSQAYKDLIVELDILSTLATHSYAHPNLVHLIGTDISFTDRPMLLLEYVDGPNLEVFLSGICRAHQQYLEGAYLIGRKEDRLPRRTAFAWSLQLLRALHFLHTHDPAFIIMHRDLKPANLLLTADLATLKVADFGMGKKVERARRDSQLHRGHTGTLRYMAPEVLACRRGNYTEACDIYSAALVMWYVAVCQRPPDQRVDTIDRRPALEPVGWPGLEELLAQMWAADPRQRPSAEQVAPCFSLAASLL